MKVGIFFLCSMIMESLFIPLITGVDSSLGDKTLRENGALLRGTSGMVGFKPEIEVLSHLATPRHLEAFHY